MEKVKQEVRILAEREKREVRILAEREKQEVQNLRNGRGGKYGFDGKG